MPDTSKNVAIGALVTFAVGLTLWVLLFLHPSFGDGKFRLHVRFSDIEKINVGTRVTYAGRAVGEVINIAQVPENQRTASANPDAIYIYDLTLAIDSKVPLYDSDEITVGTSGLMGERFISVIPRRPKNHKATPIAYNEVIYSSKAPSMEDAFAQVSRVAIRAEETMQALATLVQDNRNEVDSTMDSLKEASYQLKTLLTSANNAKIIDTLASAATQFERTMTQTQGIIARVSDGEGSLGKLLVSNDFYLKTAGVMNKIDVLMNDVNHYGVLYHLDKSWQRDRRKRIEELASLESPQQFRTFINDEMYKITTGVSRLGMALDKAQAEAKNDAPLVANSDFGRSFNELLAQIQDLQSTLKIYSIEIADRQPKTHPENTVKK